MEKSLVLVCLLVAGLQVVTCQSLAPESCIHYSYPQQADCLSFTNCSGAQCNITSPSGHASFVVHKCQDPVAVDLTVVTQNSNFQRMFDHSEHLANVSAYWSDASVTMSRNATHLHFQASGDIATVLIPSVVVPLNPRVCMCQSMQNVTQAIHFPATVPIPYSCNRTTTCDGVHCRFSDYISNITVDPCSEEVTLTLYGSDGSTAYQRMFNDSQTFNLPSNLAVLGSTATLSFVIVHHSYSMEIEISLGVNIPVFGHRTVQVLPRRTIILDKSNCSSNTTTLPPTHSPLTPSQPTNPTVSQTCQALRTLASSSSSCNTTHSCTMVECTMLGYHSGMTILPCHTPPALRLVTRNSTGGVVLNQTLTQSRMIVVSPLSLNVTVDHVNSETIAVQVDVITPGGQSVTLVPRTAIPIDRSHCPGYTPHPHTTTPSHPHMHTPMPPHSTHASPTHPHSSTPSYPDMHTPMPPHSSTHGHTSPPIPTQTPLPTPPCPAMDHMATFFRAHLSCEISPTCDLLNCTGEQEESYVALMLLPCYSPPAFKLIFARTGNFLWEHTFTHSEEVLFTNYLNISLSMSATVNHISASVIGVQVNGTTGGTATYVPYTEVPLDIGSCPSTGMHEGSQLTVAVVIPVSLGLCLAVVAVAVVTVVLVWRRCKRSGQYQFHRMRFSEVKTDAED